MNAMPSILSYLLSIWGAITFTLVVLVVYGNTLSTREDDQLFLNGTEEKMMASVQRELIGKMDRLAPIVVSLAVASGVLLAVSGGVWVWLGLTA